MMRAFFAGLMWVVLCAAAYGQYTVTVGNKTGANPNPGGHFLCFYVNGQESPALTLVRGQTYTFTMSNVDSFHIFYISTSSTGAGAGQFTTGVTPSGGVTGNATLTFVVPATAPATLYYQCRFHLQMGWKLNIVDPAAVTGTISLLDFSGTIVGRPVTFDVMNGATLVETHVANLTATGTYSFPTTHTGTFDVYAKSSHWLRKVRTGVVFGATGASGVNLSLLNGDINDDNEVGIGDYATLSGAYNSFLGDPGFVANADLNGDDAVDIADYAILSSNYGLFGD